MGAKRTQKWARSPLGLKLHSSLPMSSSCTSSSSFFIRRCGRLQQHVAPSSDLATPQWNWRALCGLPPRHRIVQAVVHLPLQSDSCAHGAEEHGVIFLRPACGDRRRGSGEYSAPSGDAHASCWHVVRAVPVAATPQMTRFRDAKVCNKWLQVRIHDHRIQSDYKYKSELQNPEGKKSVLGVTSAW